MKRHEDGKRAASIGVEQFDEWKYIYIYIYIYIIYIYLLELYKITYIFINIT